MNGAETRNPAMDIIRAFALLFVVSVHFFLYTDYYTVTIEGGSLYVMTLLRTFVMICVPLFMVLTGYLNLNKKVSKEYYTKIIKILGIYFLASCACVLYSIFILKKPVGFLKFVGGLFSYENAPYSWYVEMYIGLFLLCPFLNLMYKGIESKKHKQILILTFVLLTVLPGVMNSVEFSLDWLKQPSRHHEYVKILPDFWVKMYPITYYFIGCYLKEYKPKIKSRYIFILMLLVFFANGTFNYYRSYGTAFVGGTWQDYFGPGQVVMTTLFFVFFLNLNYKKFPKSASVVLKHISNLSFGAYLVSWIFDSVFYEILCSNVSGAEERFKYFLPAVFVIYICSLALSAVIEGVYNTLSLACRKVFVKDKRKILGEKTQKSIF